MTDDAGSGAGDRHEQWIKEPTDRFHGIRVVDQGGAVFVEQVDDDGEERQSIMIEADEVDDLISALVEVSNRNAE